VCGACEAEQPAFDRARSVLVYDSASRGPLLAFKHADRTDAAPTFARLMVRAAAELLPETDLIVPVPLHRRRLLARRFNQSALLAQAIGREASIDAVPDLLVRSRHTPSQGGLSASARRRNVAGAFSLRKGSAEKVDGARMLVVDDVYTTGATVSACAAVLRRAGAVSVDILTLARVVRPTLL
jgi:ComF family protein